MPKLNFCMTDLCEFEACEFCGQNKELAITLGPVSFMGKTRILHQESVLVKQISEALDGC